MSRYFLGGRERGRKKGRKTTTKLFLLTGHFHHRSFIPAGLRGAPLELLFM